MYPNRNPNPYSIISEQGFYRFDTESGVVYTCTFNPVPIDSPIELNDFQFYPNKLTIPDQRVAVTVVQVLQDYFTAQEKALMYICDPTDSKWKARLRLFRQWQETMGEMFDRHELEIKVGDLTAYGSVLVRKDFPYNYTPGLIDKARGIVIEKF